jgi:hypothetical protein
VYPLKPDTPWKEPRWIDATGKQQDTTPASFETNEMFWRVLDDTIQKEPPYEGYRSEYGNLSALGIQKGRPFAPDKRMAGILQKAATEANAQMRVQSFFDRRPDRQVWPDRQWEWASLRFEDGDFNAGEYLDLEAREKWFYQAIGASPAMFRRDANAGSLYWLGLRDANGALLDGGKNYRLTVPLPVPGKLFWSVTVYDLETRSQIQTAQNKAALRSLFELANLSGDSVELFFGPENSAHAGKPWIQTLPGRGWFTYFRIYGPQAAAFDGTWKPGDIDVAM